MALEFQPGYFSARLELQPIGREDAKELLAVFQDPAVRRYLLDDQLVTLDWVHDEIATSIERFTSVGAGLWALRLHEATEIIGFVGFRPFFEPPRLQLLYGLLPAYWGRGLATEAAARACDHAFSHLGFDHVEAATDEPNRRSIRVLEQLGMSRDDDAGLGHPGTVFFCIDRATWQQRGAP
ncbi:MAG: GNAT family N-acetyltransferase [Thermoanaerobaculia bacterium]|nr:GNAT family N-acetyltransferase [Thermoanaerobaculia bacterium]